MRCFDLNKNKSISKQTFLYKVCTKSFLKGLFLHNVFTKTFHHSNPSFIPRKPSGLLILLHKDKILPSSHAEIAVEKHEVKWMMQTSCNLRSNLASDSLELSYQPSFPFESSRLRKLFRKLVTALPHFLRDCFKIFGSNSYFRTHIHGMHPSSAAGIFDPGSQVLVL